MNNKEILQKIALTPKGFERATLLEDETIRNAVLSSGANVTIYEGDISCGKSVKEMLSGVSIGLIQRKNKKGNFDGLGALGGLAERTSAMEFAFLSSSQRRALVGQKDDVILVDNIPTLCFDINIIRKNNVLRELREELADIGINDITINPDNLELIFMDNVRDDNYMINIWDGNGECFAINPYCHVYKDDIGLIDKIIEKSSQQENGEVSEYKKIPLFEALKAYENRKNATYTLEDGRDALRDYRYPHEYLTAWALASKLLEYDDEKMISLALEVQKETKHLISFEKVAKATKQSMEDVADVLGVSLDTLNKMENACKSSWTSKCMNDKFRAPDSFSL